MIAEFDCTNFSMQNLKITDEEIIINGLKTPISSILDVVLFPIGEHLRGLGGCIKFVTKENPELPVRNDQRGWDIVHQGDVISCYDFPRVSCFWYGGDYTENGWIEQNKKAEEITAIVIGMLPHREKVVQVSEPEHDVPLKAAQTEKKRSFFDKLKGKKK